MARAKYSEAAGLVVYVVLTLIFSAFVPSPTCRDGWRSPSIGSTGACSHHGGVDYQVDKYLLAAAAGGAIGFLTYFLSARIERRKSEIRHLPIDPSVLGPAELVSLAIQTRQCISFTYSAPGAPPAKRFILPAKLAYSAREGRPSVLCVTGFCQLKQAERTFAFSRMSQVRIASGPNSLLKGTDQSLSD